MRKNQHNYKKKPTYLGRKESVLKYYFHNFGTNLELEIITLNPFKGLKLEYYLK